MQIRTGLIFLFHFNRVNGLRLRTCASRKVLVWSQLKRRRKMQLSRSCTAPKVTTLETSQNSFNRHWLNFSTSIDARLISFAENFERHGGAGTRLWTSGSDSKVNNRWFWTTTGQPITGFTDWRPDEPSPQYVGEDYLDLWISSDKSGWNDSPNDPGEFGWEVFPLCEL